MKLSDFDFDLPKNLIAQYPLENRDECRLMILDREKKSVKHALFKDIYQYFDEGDRLVMNDTKVFPAKLVGLKESTKVEIEILLLRELSEDLRLWDAVVHPARKIRIGNKIYFREDSPLVAEVVDNTTSRGRTLRFLYDGKPENFRRDLYAEGLTPLPEYIERPIEKEDEGRYQTIFAKEEGAVIAPSAGMHFTRELMKRLAIKGVDTSYITMHISLCSDRTIDVEDLYKYKPESEELRITEQVVQEIAQTRAKRKKVCAVGTSVSKALEGFPMPGRNIKSFSGWESKFIFPPYHFEVADSLITNFQMPLSMFFMHVCAFGGYDFVKSSYQMAIAEGYQFGDYGDAMLIL